MLFAITVLLIVLKLVGVLHISWLVAFAPILVGLALFIAIFLLSFFGVLVGGVALSRFIR